MITKKILLLVSLVWSCVLSQTKWELITIPENPSLTGMVFADNQWVGVSVSGHVFISKDGRDWKDSKNLGVHFTGITYGSGKYVASGQIDSGQNSGCYVFTSANGETWDTTQLKGQWMLNNITYGNNIFVAVGYPYYATSVDGKNWDLTFAPGVIYTALAKKSATADRPPATCYEVSFGEGKFFSGCGNGLYFSEDGKKWTNLISYAEAGIYAMGKWVIGTDNTVLTSTDTSIWMTFELNKYIYSKRILYKDGIFVLVGSKGIYTSSDGNSWSNLIPEDSVSIFSTSAYGDGYFLISIWGGKIIKMNVDPTSIRRNENGQCLRAIHKSVVHDYAEAFEKVPGSFHWDVILHRHNGVFLGRKILENNR